MLRRFSAQAFRGIISLARNLRRIDLLRPSPQHATASLGMLVGITSVAQCQLSETLEHSLQLYSASHIPQDSSSLTCILGNIGLSGYISGTAPEEREPKAPSLKS